MSDDKKTPFSEATIVQSRPPTETVTVVPEDNSPLEPVKAVQTLKASAPVAAPVAAPAPAAMGVSPPPNPRARDYSKLQNPVDEDPDFSTIDAGSSLGSVGTPVAAQAPVDESVAAPPPAPVVVTTEAPVHSPAQAVANAIAASTSSSNGAIVGGAAADAIVGGAAAKTKFNIKREEEPDRAPVSERTMVYAQESLNDTFDARTVVRPNLPKEAPVLPKESPIDPAPAGASSTDEPHDDVDGHSRLINASEEARKMTPEERRALRAKLDRRTRQMFIAFAVVGVIGLGVLLHALTTGPSLTPNGPAVAKSETKSTTDGPAQKIDEKRDIASTAPQNPVGNAQTTADLLGKFDQAALKTQEQVREYSSSVSGF